MKLNWYKIDAIGLGGFLEKELIITSVFKNGYVGCLSGEWYEADLNIFVM